MFDQFGAVGSSIAHGDQISSAQTWFAAGERISYDAKARAIVAGGDAPPRIFLRQEGDPAQAVSFLPGFADGSFGWAKVRQHLPNADEMPKLFLDYVGMGDSDKPQDYAYSIFEPDCYLSIRCHADLTLTSSGFRRRPVSVASCESGLMTPFF
jgi:pimeloyl-ACP methyl ester carboxylesterase